MVRIERLNQFGLCGDGCFLTSWLDVRTFTLFEHAQTTIVGNTVVMCQLTHAAHGQ